MFYLLILRLLYIVIILLLIQPQITRIYLHLCLLLTLIPLFRVILLSFLCLQSHIPSLRRTPSVSPLRNTRTQHFPPSPTLDHRTNDHPRNFQRIHTVSPIAFAQSQLLPFFAAPQPFPLPPQPAPLPLHPNPPTYPPLPHHHNFRHTANLQTSYINSSLPSTKDVPLLMNKHDWGLWHLAVCTLILNANLLGHIADDPLPGAAFDPGFWPTYPPRYTPMLHTSRTVVFH